MDKTQGFRLPKPPGGALPEQFADAANLTARVAQLERYLQQLHTVMQLVNRHVPMAQDGGGFDFRQMLDTLIEAPESPHVPVFDDSFKKWRNRQLAAGDVKLNVVEVDASYTIEKDVDVVLADCTTADLVLSLHAIADLKGHRVYIMRVDGSAHAIDVDGSGSETINGASGFTLSSQYENAILISGPNEWSRWS